MEITKKEFEHYDELKSSEWAKPTKFKESKLQKTLPFPRLEMRLERDGETWYNYVWIYGIVYKHFSDAILEKDKKEFVFLPLSRTKGSSSVPPWKGDLLDLPFRDGTHIKHERDIFNLPAFILCEELGVINKITEDSHNKEILDKMKRNGNKIFKNI